MAAAVVDLAFLSSHLNISEQSLDVAVTEPTSALVQNILAAVFLKVTELLEEKERLSIELEAAVRGSESRCEQYKATADKALHDADDIRQKLGAAENAREALENELQVLKSTNLASNSQIDELQSRVATLESNNREKLEIIESKSRANDELSEELQKQHQRIVKLNQDINSLNQAVQKAETAENSAKYREQSLKQELEHAKQNSDWYSNELKEKSDQLTSTRREKNTCSSELEGIKAEKTYLQEALTSTEQQMRERVQEAQAKADEAFSKVQQLEDAATRSKDDFAAQLETYQRLAQLKDQQAATHRTRLEAVEKRLQKVQDDHSVDLQRLNCALKEGKEDLSLAEKRADELEAEVDRLKALVDSHNARVASAPQTPRLNGSLMGRSGSPVGTPSSLLGKSSIRASEAFDQYHKIKVQLAREQRRSENLQERLDETISILEAKVPELVELHAENERLRSEAVEMSEIMEQSFTERDEAAKASRKAQAIAATAKAEADILRMQLRDLSAQIHLLIFNAHAQEKGLPRLTDEEAALFERVQRGEYAEEALADMSDTHQYISQQLVVFKNIHELQTRNQDLLRITRELADTMENEEAMAKRNQAVQDHEEVQTLRNTVTILRDEIKSLTSRMNSYMTERDMFRRMLQNKSGVSEVNAIMGSSGGSHREVLASIEQTSPEDAGLADALRELQAQYDSYRSDQESEHKSLKEQVDRLSSERNGLQRDLSSLKSQVTLATERLDMLQSNYKAEQENTSLLRKQNQTLSEAAAKSDFGIQTVAEDLVAARGMVDSLNKELNNLRIEKQLHKSIQERLNQDNESLSQEKARLNSLLASHQSLLNEREMNESESRRRMQSQIGSLTTELARIRAQLEEEIKEGKMLRERKEYDARQMQKRIDDLTTAIGKVKEELVAVTTTRDHLQARANQLEVELRHAQEKNDRLQPQLTSRSQACTSGEKAVDDDENQTRIEELENEVHDLKTSLEMANTQLESAKQQVEQYRELVQAHEDDLASVNETLAQYREETDASVAGKEKLVDELRSRVEALTTELGISTHELNNLRDSQAAVARQFEDKERLLQDEIGRLKEEETGYKEAVQQHRQDLRDQAEIATKAQRDYETELIKHGEAAKLLGSLRLEHNKLKTEAAQLRAAAESAKMMLAQGERSWEERRQQLEQEGRDIKARLDDVNAQNKILHQQLDSLTKQIGQLKQKRSALETLDDGPAAASADVTSEGLRELNQYLRREKEIVEVQFDLKDQEAKRLQQQLLTTQSQLDETRVKLDQERDSRSGSKNSSIAHQDLMAKLNELNLLRESNTTLRSEKERAQAQIEEKNGRIEVLEGKIQPLEARVAELESDKAFMEAEIKQLHDARDGLQKRIESILSKYGQADPAELEQLKASIQELESERDRLKETSEDLQRRLSTAEEAAESEKASWKSTREKLAEDFKNRYRTMKAQRDDSMQEQQTLQQYKTQLEAALETANQRASTLEQELAQTRQELVHVREKNEQAEWQAPAPASSERQQPSQEVSELSQQLEQVKRELEVLQRQNAEASSEVARFRAELDTAMEERDAARAHASESADLETIAGAKPPQSAAAPMSTCLPDEERRALEEEAAAAEARAALAEQKVTEVENKIEQTIKQRSEKMKAALNSKLSEYRRDFNKQADDIRAEYEAKLATVKTEFPLGALPSTPVKATDPQMPPTPTAATISAGNLPELSDAQVRELIAKHPTAQSIVRNNVSKFAEQKVSQQVNIAEKKSALRISMLDKEARSAQAKIAVVQTAARDTPQRPVSEVWEMAKNVRAPEPAPGPAPARPQLATATAPLASATTPVSAKSASPVAGASLEASSVPSVPAVSTDLLQAAKPSVNPFGQPSQQIPANTPAAHQQTQAPQQAAGGTKTGIPMPRGGSNVGRGRGSTYRGGQGPRGRGGNFANRGGATAAGLNPQVGDFSPTNAATGNKRPRGESELGANGAVKRPRGGHAGGTPQA